MDNIENKDTTVKGISGYLHRLIPIADKSGRIISHALKPMLCEFKMRDALQVMIGAALMAMPICLTEEA